ncbi:MAG: PAS domain S-box protein, partial [Acidimicrobiia bacterium]
MSDPALLFWLVAVGAGLCLGVSLAVVIAGLRRGLAEIALLGASLTTLSALSLVHGLTAPGYLFGPNSVTATAMLFAFPAGAVAALPLVIPHGAPWLARRWRGFTWGVVAATALSSGVLLAVPDLSVPERGAVVWLVAFTVSSVTMVLVVRQSWLFAIGRRRASLVAAVSIGVLGAGALLGLVSAWDSPAWWAAHVIDTAAALATAIALLVAYRWEGTLETALTPVVAREPLAALELGLAPEVHAFVAALDRKDAQTRDHVVRTCVLAMRLGERTGLSPRRLRDVGLGGLLHDIGKLVVPTDILTKPGRLTDAEFDAIRTHSERGAALLEASRTLQSVAPLVRWHHERDDGTGYPDGLAGDDLSLEAAIVSVSDAWDAIVNTRHYRAGLQASDARQILHDGAGRQWKPEAVQLLLAEVDTDADADPPALDGVGRGTLEPSEIDGYVAPCLDALPAEIAVLGHAALNGQRSSHLRSGADHYRDFFERAPFAYFSVGIDARIVAANHRAEALLGAEPGALAGRSVLELYADTKDGRARAAQLFQRFAAGETLRDEELEMRRSDGESVWISLTAEPVHDGTGRVIASRSVALDVTSRRAAEDALRDREEQFRRMFEDAPIGMSMVCPDGTLLAANDALANTLGYTASDLIGRRMLDFVHADDRTAARHEISAVQAGTSDGHGVELRVRTIGGSVRHAHVTLSLLQSGDPEPCVLAHIQDVTERRRVEEELRLLALHDPLTGLYNRRGLEIAALQRADHHDASLLFVDVDDLKRINDGHGHASGDAALVAIARILREAAGEHHIAARIGGDEFCVLVLGAASDPDVGG